MKHIVNMVAMLLSCTGAALTTFVCWGTMDAPTPVRAAAWVCGIGLSFGVPFALVRLAGRGQCN